MFGRRWLPVTFASTSTAIPLTGGVSHEHRQSDTGVCGDSNGATATSGAGAAGQGTGTAAGTGEGPRIVLGEITAYRCWANQGGVYRSLNGALWRPDKPMSGEGIALNNTKGVYAFRTLKQAQKEAQGYNFYSVGSVKMWGTIIEHDDGFRAEFAQIDQIIDNPIKDKDNNTTYVLDLLEKERGQEQQFRYDNERDRYSYSFRCERYGDFLSVFVERHGQKLATALSLIGVASITKNDGMPVGRSNRNFNLATYGPKPTIYANDAPYRVSSMIEFPPQPTNDQQGTIVWASTSDASTTIRVDDCPTPAQDDMIYFNGTGIKLWVPYGLGDQVYGQILDAMKVAKDA